MTGIGHFGIARYIVPNEPAFWAIVIYASASLYRRTVHALVAQYGVLARAKCLGAGMMRFSEIRALSVPARRVSKLSQILHDDEKRHA